jgi:hypothetical protein
VTGWAHDRGVPISAPTTRRRRYPVGRWLAATLALLAVGALAAACSPVPRYVTAVYLDDGHPTALFHPCPGSPVYGLKLYDAGPVKGKALGRAPTSGLPTGATPSGIPRTTVNRDHLRWDVGDQDEGTAHTRVRLLTVPPGWDLSTSEQDLLRQLRSDRTYRLIGWGFRNTAVDFTLADLAALGDRRVWASARGSAEPRALTRDDFVDRAEASCED